MLENAVQEPTAQKRSAAGMALTDSLPAIALGLSFDSVAVIQLQKALWGQNGLWRPHSSGSLRKLLLSFLRKDRYTR